MILPVRATLKNDTDTGRTMDPYVRIVRVGDENDKNKWQNTKAHNGGGKTPKWPNIAPLNFSVLKRTDTFKVFVMEKDSWSGKNFL